MKNKVKLKRILSDPKLFIENIIKIVDKKQQTVPFKLNEMQGEFLEFVEDNKYIVLLKSRQVGGSVLCMAYAIWLSITRPNSTCLLMSYSKDSAGGIFAKLKQMYFSIPSVLRPKLTNNSKEELRLENGSRIITATCGTKDVARGLTLNFAHLSEVGLMESDKLKRQLVAIEQALTPNSKIILESTAQGFNHFSDIWQKAKDGDNMYSPYFSNWYDNKSMFKDDYADAVAMWKARNNGNMLQVEELDAEELDLMGLGATIEQLIWRRLKIANSSKDKFYEEYPSSDTQAFVATGNSVFESNLIEERLRYLPKHLNRNELKGLNEILKQHLNQSLFIWEKPKKDVRYFIGCDGAEGVGGDYSVIEIYNQDAVQVAEFRNNKIAPHVFSEIVHLLAVYYNTAFLVIEKASAGHTIVSKLRFDYRYRNMYMHRSYDARGRSKKSVGFVTDSKTKPLMINNFREKFEEGQILINSKTLLEEMKVFKIEGSKMGAIAGRNDDTVMATAMALMGIDAGIWYI